MSEKLIGSCIFGQSGGPTAVINASAYGVIKTALEAGEITRVYGASYGIKGVLADRLYVMDEEDPEELRLLLNTPSSELGSCRYKMADPEVDDTDYKRILEIFRKYDVRYFFYNGGNDSMDTCNKISRYMESVGYPCWLAASASLASAYGFGPDLVYLPEVDFDMDRFLSDVDRVYREKGKVLVAVSEGIHYADGTFVSEAETSATDGFGHVQLGGLAALLADAIRKHSDAKVRGIELSLLQRCAAHIASKTDIDEAFGAGQEAVRQAVAGVSGKMVAFERETVDGAYHCRYVMQPLDTVANVEKKIPPEWINEEGNGLTKEFIDYVRPLVQGEPELPLVDSMPRYANLKKVLAGRD